jgi:ABC-type transporter Mla subunit MlaD
MDLDRYMDTLDKAVQSANTLLTKLEEENRMVRMIEAFDKLGPTLDSINNLLVEINEPFSQLIKDPAVLNTFKGASKVFNSRNTHKMIKNMSESFEPEQITRFMDNTDRFIATFDEVVKVDGPFMKSFDGMNRLVNSGKLDKLISSMEKMTSEKKMERILNNVNTLSTQMAKIGPQIPVITRETISTMRELTIVLKALQKTWLLDNETEEVLKELRKNKSKK